MCIVSIQSDFRETYLVAKLDLQTSLTKDRINRPAHCYSTVFRLADEMIQQYRHIVTFVNIPTFHSASYLENRKPKQASGY